MMLNWHIIHNHIKVSCDPPQQDVGPFTEVHRSHQLVIQAIGISSGKEEIGHQDLEGREGRDAT